MMTRGETVLSAHQVLVEQVASQRPILDNLQQELFPADNGPKPRSLIEISGASKSGKSLLLWQLMARCLPPTYFGGRYADVLLIDLGHQFSMPNFQHYLKHVITQSGENNTEQECVEVARKCLDSVTFFRCYSALEFELALDAVENLLLENHNIALLAIDNVDAFYWLDAHNKRLRISTHYTKVLAKLQRICADHNICCAFTANSNYVKTKTSVDEASSLQASTDVRYKIRLNLLSDGTRTLNDRPIYIDHNGIRFL